MRNLCLKQLMQIGAVSILLLALTGCATYKSSFNCGDAKGAYCASMDRVDQMIQSGEIERFNEQRRKEKYKAQEHAHTLPIKRQGAAINIVNKEGNDARD